MLRSEEPAHYPVYPSSPLLNREAREAAHRWLARFNPLLDEMDGLRLDDCRRLLGEVPALRSDGQMALQRLEGQATQTDAPMLTTLRSALTELDSLEADLRRRVGQLAPGDPDGRVELDQIQARLAESAARREVETLAPSTGVIHGSRLEIQTSYPNWGAALGAAFFSLVWNGFTTVHACFMIWGLSQAIGPFALALLLFYALFWAAGFAMVRGAFVSACSEHLTLQDRELTLTRRVLGYTWSKTFTLGPESRARLIQPTMKAKGSATMDVGIRDERGREVRFAPGQPWDDQQRIIARINERLGVRG